MINDTDSDSEDGADDNDSNKNSTLDLFLLRKLYYHLARLACYVDYRTPV